MGQNGTKWKMEDNKKWLLELPQISPVSYKKNSKVMQYANANQLKNKNKKNRPSGDLNPGLPIRSQVCLPPNHGDSVR